MMSPLFLIGNILAHFVFIDASNFNRVEVGFVIFTQNNEYHNQLFLKKKREILNQDANLKQFHANIFKSYELANSDVGHWTLFPLLEKLSTYGEHNWLFFLEEVTEINLKKLRNVFKKYNSSEDVFVGYELQDKDQTIIHHFAAPSSLLYPHFSSGFFISSSLLQRLVSRLPVDEEYSFSVDPKYEFAKFVWDSGNGVQLLHDDQFCLSKINENCATWIDEQFPNCGLPVSSVKLHVGVKTCRKYHKERITVVKNTWAPEAKNLTIFSDQEDPSVPTTKINLENVAHGHCEKTLRILKYYIENNISFHWLAIVDDDTIISIRRLRKLLTCYNASDTVVIGERYGYGVAYTVGYDYITGGGGMIFSYPAVRQLIENCQCPSIDSPDDMIIGLCLKRMEIPAIHSPYFHQARPSDYSSEFLKPFKHISFHKHWHIDPYSVYHEWLEDTAAELHVEL